MATARTVQLMRQESGWVGRLFNPQSYTPEYQELKFALHRKLLDRINLEALSSVASERVRNEVRAGGSAAGGRRADAAERGREGPRHRGSAGRSLRTGTAGAAAGRSDHLRHPGDHAARWCTSSAPAKLYRTPVEFKDNAHLLRIIEKVVSRVGRRVDESSPLVDARLPDGSRVNAAIPPVAVDGPLLSIRRFGRDPLRGQDLVENLGADCRHAGAARSLRQGPAEHPDLGRNRRRQNHSAERAVGLHSRRRAHRHHRRRGRTEAATRSTWRAWKRGRPISKAPAPSTSASWSSMRCVCGRTASSSARSAAKKRWTCCRP